MTIHTVGDSHSLNGWWDGIIIHHLGAILCYSFGKEIFNRCDIRSFDLKDGDSIIFCFGEIDCRCHVHKNILPEKSYQQIIDEIVNDYIHAIKANIESISQISLHLCTFKTPILRQVIF